MKTREEVARFVEKQLADDKKVYKCQRRKAGRHHYGAQELRELLDFVFGGQPQTQSEQITLGGAYK